MRRRSTSTVDRIARFAVVVTLAIVALASVGRTLQAPVESEASVQVNRVHRVIVLADAKQREWMAAEGYDIAGHDLRADRVEVITDYSGLERLRERRLEFNVLESRPAGLMGDPGPAVAGRPPSTSDPLPDQAYTDPAELEAFLNQVTADHPDIARLEAIGTSVEGRTIWALMISDNAAVDEDELAILFNSAHHGREVMTPEVLIDMIDHLTDNYGVDPAITARVDAYQIWIVPMVNPDGVELVFTEDRWWRKNLRDNDGNGGIGWKDGVDVNRNYEWGFGGQCVGSSGSGSAATYRGAHESSEPEAAAMIELGRRLRPVFYVEYHSHGEDVFYALGCDPTLARALSTVVGPDQSISRVIAEDYAAEIVQADGGIGFLASPFGSRVDGIGRDQHAHDSGAIAFVTEINIDTEGGFQPNYATWRDATVQGQRPGWSWLIDRIGGPAIGGHVVDAVSGQPLLADVTLDELTRPDGGLLTTIETTGRFHIIVVPGAYTLRVSASGYQDAAGPMVVGTTWQPIQVALQPLGSERILYENFEDPATVAGWSTSDANDDARDGLWEWGDPHATYSGDLLNQDLVLGTPPLDRSPAGNHAFVTGNEPNEAFDRDDVDDGVVTLTSPAIDLNDRYGVELSWQLWFYNEPDEPLDVFEVELSGDGGATWVPAGVWLDPTSTTDAAQSWVRQQLRVDDFVAAGPDVRVRFRVTDDGSETVVEAAIDELEIRGYSLTDDGRIDSLRFSGADGLTVEWDAVPGAPDAVFDMARGDLAQVVTGGVTIDLGALTCLGSGIGGTTFTLDAGEVPPPDTAWFYVTRFRLGLTEGDWGRASDGTPRNTSTTCP